MIFTLSTTYQRAWIASVCLASSAFNKSDDLYRKVLDVLKLNCFSYTLLYNCTIGSIWTYSYTLSSLILGVIWFFVVSSRNLIVIMIYKKTWSESKLQEPWFGKGLVYNVDKWYKDCFWHDSSICSWCNKQR